MPLILYRRKLLIKVSPYNESATGRRHRKRLIVAKNQRTRTAFKGKQIKSQRDKGIAVSTENENNVVSLTADISYFQFVGVDCAWAASRYGISIRPNISARVELARSAAARLASSLARNPLLAPSTRMATRQSFRMARLLREFPSSPPGSKWHRPNPGLCM